MSLVKRDISEGKAINFGLIYGMSAFGLAKQIGVARGEAQEYIDHTLLDIPVWRITWTYRALAHEQGYVETLLGRRLYLQEIARISSGSWRRSERRLTPHAGTAADIIKLAMIAVDGWLTDSALDAKMIMGS